MNKTYLYIGAGILAAILGIAAYAYTQQQSDEISVALTTASYLCRDGKSIDAVFGEKTVTLTLSDTRAFVLPLAASASGVRYQNNQVTFTTKGTNAFLEEDGVQTYSDCVVNGSSSNNNTNANTSFSDSGQTFTFTYPPSVAVSGGDGSFTQGWSNNETSLGLILAKGMVSKSLQPQTNFSDATLLIGTSAEPSAVRTCTIADTGAQETGTGTRDVNGTLFTVLTSTDAGAGNRYETTKYRTVRNNQCYTVEYTIHYTNIENYGDDSDITEFDKAEVIALLESMVQSFQFTDGG